MEAIRGNSAAVVGEGDFTRRDMAPYRDMARRLRRLGYPAPSDDALGNVGRMLEACVARYERLYDALTSNDR